MWSYDELFDFIYSKRTPNVRDQETLNRIAEEVDADVKKIMGDRYGN